MTKPLRPRGRITLREVIERNQQALDMYAAFSDKPRVVLEMPPEPKKRAPSAPSIGPSEGDIQSGIVQLLRVHPKVAWFGRFNSGVALAEDGGGQRRYTAYYRLYLRGLAARSRRLSARSRGLSDILGQLNDGRLFIIEVKSRLGRATPEQNEFIDIVLKAGGVAGVCRSVDEALKLLERA